MECEAIASLINTIQECLVTVGILVVLLFFAVLM